MWSTGNSATRVSLVCALTSLLVACASRSEATFTEVGAAMAVDNNGQGRSVGAGDYDDDGWIDLYVGNVGENNILYRNRMGEGGQPFDDVTSAAGVDNDAETTWGVLWADADRDGDLDLYVANDFGGPNRYYRNDGSVFVESQTALGIEGLVNNMGVAWSDYDRDGDLDLYDSCLGTNPFYRSDGSNYQEIAPALGVDDGTVGFTVAWGDYDNDGDPDLLCTNLFFCFPDCNKKPGERRGAGPTKLWRNDGSVLTDVTSTLHPQLEDEAVGASWADYDNDGDLDVFIGRKTLPDALFRNDGASFTDVAPGFGMDDAGDTRGGIWGDYDLDGDLDLFVTSDGPNHLYRNDGTTFTEVASAEGVKDSLNTGSGTGAVWFDYDRDGDLDLYVVRRAGTNRLFRNDLGNGNRWLHVKTVGVQSNPDGIGTRVTVVAGADTMMQEVVSGDGYFSQATLLLEFGVGSATTAASISARWPSGIVQTLTNEPTNAVVTLTEPVPIGDFQETGAVHGLDDEQPGRGLAWGDYDGDNDLDLFVATVDTNRLYRNDGGTFTEVAGVLGIHDPGSASNSAIWLDYDNDSNLDLFVSGFQGGQNRLWRNLGGAASKQGTSFEDVAPALGIDGVGFNNWGAAWGDFDRDGDLDLYQTRRNQANALYQNNGASFTDVAAAYGVDDAGFGRMASWADYDEDGWIDLYVVTDSANVLFNNTAGTGFTDVTATAQVDRFGYGRGVAWGDTDNDGDLDLIVVGNGPSSYFLNNGDGTFTASEVEYGLGFFGNDYGPVLADFDGDMDLDLTLVSEGGASRLMENRGTEFVNVAHLEGVAHYGKCRAAAWADADDDGDLDLFYTIRGEANRFYERTTAIGSNWLRVRLVGTASNRAGVGAKVEVTAGGITQTRLVEAGSGWMSQGELWPHFFLGAAGSASTVRRTWPSGAVDQISNVAANRTIVLTEGMNPTDVLPAGRGPARFALLGNSPNPFNPTTTIRYDVPVPSRVRLVVFDLSGRRVRVLVDGRVEAGFREIAWDGRDDGGRDVSSGIYVTRLESGAFQAASKMTLVK